MDEVTNNNSNITYLCFHLVAKSFFIIRDI